MAFRLLIFLGVFAFTFQGCSYKGIHEGLKYSEKHQCHKLMEPDRTHCLESLDYSFEEYERETQKGIKK